MSHRVITDGSDYFMPRIVAEKSKINQTVVASFIDNKIKDLLDSIYPVGSIYFTTNRANPKTTLKFGTWVQQAMGRSIMGAGNGVNYRGCATRVTADGAVWIRVMHQTRLFDNRTQAQDNEEADRWSKMKYINDYYGVDGYIELILQYPNISARFKQKAGVIGLQYYAHGPTQVPQYVKTDPVNPSNADVQTGLYVPFTSNYFGGLRQENNGYAVSCSRINNRSQWHFPIGEYVGYDGHMIGAASASSNGADEVSSIVLWVRVDNLAANNAPLDIGGEYQDIVTIGKLPCHTHRTYRSSGSNSSSSSNRTTDRGGANNYTAGNYTRDTGGNAPHNNMQPYKAVFVWRRTA